MPGQNKWILLLLAGLLLLVLALPVSGPKEQETEGTKKETEVEEDYASQAEEKLERILTQMEGAGKVKVMITLSSSSEKVVEKDEETSQDESRTAQVRPRFMRRRRTGARRLMWRKNSHLRWKA